MATVREDDRKAERGQWTIKSKLLDPETTNAFRLAAGKAEMALGDWAVARLREAALAELGRPVERPQPPARIEDVADRIMTAVDQRLSAMEARLVAPPPASPPVPEAGIPAKPPAA